MAILPSVLSAAFAALTTVSAWSTTATVNLSIPVASIEAGKNGFTGGAQDQPPFSGLVGFDLAVGDVLDLTIQFSGGQTLTIDKLTSMWAFVYADTGAQVTGTGSLALLDAQGAALYTSDVMTDVEGNGHFGQYFNDSQFPGLAAAVTLGGLHYVGTVDAYAPEVPGGPAVTTRHYSSPALYFSADGFTASVPEAPTWAVLAAGLLALGSLAKRRAR